MVGIKRKGGKNRSTWKNWLKIVKFEKIGVRALKIKQIRLNYKNDERINLDRERTINVTNFTLTRYSPTKKIQF